MKLMKSIPVVALAITLAAVPVFAQETSEAAEETSKAMEFSAPAVDFATAVATANQNANGVIISMELDYLNDQPIYAAELHDELGFSVLMIDGVSGEIIGSFVMQAKNEEALELLMDGEAYGDEDYFEFEGSEDMHHDALDKE